MAIVDRKWSALPVPYAMEFPDRVPKERYFDPDFYAMEAELLWPRVWQMACRLEEIPQPHDFVEYEILDQSIIVLRTDDMGVRAFQNACRHRGVKVVEGRGRARAGSPARSTAGATAPTARTPSSRSAKTFAEHNLAARRHRPRAGAVRGVGRVRVDQPRRRRAAAAAVHRAVRHDPRRVEGGVAAHRVVVRVPPPGELEARAKRRSSSSTTSSRRIRSSRIPGRYAPRDGAAFDAARVRRRRPPLPAHDERRHGRDGARERRAHRRGSARHRAARRPGARDRGLEAHAQRRGRAAGTAPRAPTSPTSTSSKRSGLNEPMGYCFPHYFVLPMYSSASSYRFRPLGPEETLMEIWSLTRFPEGDEPARPTPPEPWECDDPRWPPIPAQDFSNLPRQQKGLHAKGFEYMRLSERAEGHISNFERTVDGFLAGLPYEKLLPALRSINVNPLEHADRRHRLLSERRHADLRRRRRGRPRHHRRVHARARRRPHRRRRRHLLRRRRLRHPGHGHPRRSRRAPRGLHEVEAAAAAAPPRRQHARHRLERARGRPRSAT